MTVGTMGMKGTVAARKIGVRRAPLSWRMRNALRWGYIQGLIQFCVAWLAAKCGVTTLTAALRVKVRTAAGEWVDYGVVSRRKVTKAAATALATYLSDATGFQPKYHGCGTTNTAEANTQTALLGECTTALNPDTTRATGTNTVTGADNNIYQSVGTLTFDDAAGVVEHGIITTSSGAGTLLDRSVFSAINVASGDSIQFTYQLTVNYEA